jgi:hypothetical protein
MTIYKFDRRQPGRADHFVHAGARLAYPAGALSTVVL